MKKFSFCIVFSFLFTVGLIAQIPPGAPVVTNGDTLFINPDFDGDGEPDPNALNSWIVWDTTQTRPHAVYKLERNQYYPVSSSVDKRTGLNIVADKPDADNWPPVICAFDVEGNTPGHLINTRGDLTLKNIYLSGQAINTDAQTNNGATTTDDGVHHEIIGCYAEWFERFIFRSMGNDATWNLQNNYIRNGQKRAGNPWGSILICNNNRPTGKSVLKNNTFFNVNGFIFKIKHNLCDELIFENNTVVNNLVYPIFFQIHTNSSIKNNIWYNCNARGDWTDETLKQESAKDPLPYSIVDVDSVNEWGADGLYAEKLGITKDELNANYGKYIKVDVHNNWFGYSDVLENEYYQWMLNDDARMAELAAGDPFGKIKDDRGPFWRAQWMNLRTRAIFANDDGFPDCHETGNYEYRDDLGVINPDVPLVDFVNYEGENESAMCDFIKNRMWGVDDQASSLWPYDPQYTGPADTDAQKQNLDMSYWPWAEDLRLANGAALPGTDGLPIGDQNWYKVGDGFRWDDPNMVSQVVGVASRNRVTDFTMKENYPNPFNPTTNIAYTLKKTGDVRLSVYNTLGELVSTLVSEKQAAGEYTAQWNGTNTMGHVVSAGVYFTRLEMGTRTLTQKMMLIK